MTYIKNILKKIFYFLKVIKFNIKQFLPQSFLARSLVIIGLTLLVIQIITIIIFYDFHWRKIKSLVNNNIMKDIIFATSVISKEPTLEHMQQKLQEITSYINYTPQLNQQTIIPKQNILQSRTLLNFKNKLQKSIPNQIILNEYDDNDYSILKIIIHIKEDIYLTLYLEKEFFTITSFDYLIILVISFYIVILLIILQFFRLQLRPLKKLTIAAKKFGKGEKVEYITPSGSSEIRQTITNFNNMREQVENFIEQRTMLLSSVSHDLKTVLTKINLILDINPKNMQTELKEETNDMLNIINFYLNFAKTDYYNNEREEIIIKTLFNKIISSYQNKIKITIDYQQPIKKIKINVNSFTMAITSIIDNATKYATSIKITIKDNGSHSIFITLEDNGIGIPKESYNDVFKPFYKMNTARTTEKGSVGLGLYIVKDIITKHGGEITLEKSTMQGLMVKISLPFD